MGQNTSNSVWKPCEDLQKTFELCHCQQRIYNKVLRWNFVIDQILIFHHNLQRNSLKILLCDFLDFFSYFVSHNWGIPMMKITGLSHLFKWENLHNWWLTKYFFAPLYIAWFHHPASFLYNYSKLSQKSLCNSLMISWPSKTTLQRLIDLAGLHYTTSERSGPSLHSMQLNFLSRPQSFLDWTTAMLFWLDFHQTQSNHYKWFRMQWQ